MLTVPLISKVLNLVLNDSVVKLSIPVFVTAVTYMVDPVLVFPKLEVLLIVVKLIQFWNALVMLLKLVVCVVGKVIVFKDVQPLKAKVKLLKFAGTVAGRVTEVKLIQFKKVLEIPVAATEVGIVTEFKLVQPLKVLPKFTSAGILAGSVIDNKLIQPLNVLDKRVTAFKEVGIVTDSNAVQPANVEDIVVKLFCALFGKLQVIKERQLWNARFKVVIL